MQRGHGRGLGVLSVHQGHTTSYSWLLLFIGEHNRPGQQNISVLVSASVLVAEPADKDVCRRSMFHQLAGVSTAIA